MNLHVAIRRIVESFTDAVLDAVASASIEELLRVRFTTGRHDPRRPKRRRSHRRDVSARHEPMRRLVGLLQTKPGGLRSEKLRAHLALGKGAFQRVTAKALAANLVTKTGEGHATAFFAV